MTALPKYARWEHERKFWVPADAPRPWADVPPRRIEDRFERGIEALRFQQPGEVLAALLRAAGSRHVEVRRSAALTLGELDHEGALAPLLTAFELEREPLARGFLLTAIASQGGTKARDFLVRTLERGPSGTRPWCALALGLLPDVVLDLLAKALELLDARLVDELGEFLEVDDADLRVLHRLAQLLEQSVDRLQFFLDGEGFLHRHRRSPGEGVPGREFIDLVLLAKLLHEVQQVVREP